MSAIHDDLQAPVLLMAMPQVLDPYFHRSVVLLTHHEEQGSLGFIINKPTEIRVTEILKGMDILWDGEAGTVAYFGGPVQPQLGSVLYGSRDLPEPFEEGQGGSEIVPGVALTRNLADLQTLAGSPPAGFRLCLGYAGWGTGQLMDEILRNDWLTAPVQEELLFAEDAGEIWGRALRSVGVEPEALPSWTPPSSEGAN